MKKLLSVLLFVLCIACTVAAVAETSGDYEYAVLEDGTAQITRYSGSESEVTIPSVLDGYVVSSISDYAFQACTSLTSVSIPDSVTILGANPFTDCQSLKTISVSPEQPALAVIDGALFSKADKRLIWYPLTKADTSYQIPMGISVIGDQAFYDCDNLTSVSIPDSVTAIGASAFYFCSSLTSVSIPDSVTVLGVNPFSYCEKLNTITVSPEHPALAVIDGVLFSKEDKRLVCYPVTKTDTSYQIPEGISVIGDSAFSWCTSLTSVSIPDSVTTIGNSAFYFCPSLTSVSIPDSVTSIGDNAFYDCTGLTNVSIPNSATTIGDYAFDSCPSLTVTVERNSCAVQYCKENNITYTYFDSLDWLNN